jgi:hypothetical protein
MVAQRGRYAMPVFKGRFRDHQNLPMRDEDMVAFVTDANGTITKVCIGEAKTLVAFAAQAVASAHERVKKTIPAKDALSANVPVQFLANAPQTATGMPSGKNLLLRRGS